MEQPPFVCMTTGSNALLADPGAGETNRRYREIVHTLYRNVAQWEKAGFFAGGCLVEDEEPCCRSDELDALLMAPVRSASGRHVPVHSAQYLDNMHRRTRAMEDQEKECAQSDGVTGKYDAAISAGWTAHTEQSALAGARALNSCLLDVYKGAYRSAFVLSKPPSHHAVCNRALLLAGRACPTMEPDGKNPFGFCHLNSIAAAVANLLAQDDGPSKVTILDFDVHHGNGNEDTFWNDPRVQTISIHEDQGWPNSGDEWNHGGECAPGSNMNLPVPPHARDADWKHAMEEYIFPAIQAFNPGIVVVAAGFDAMGGERPYGNTKLTQYWYGWCVASLQEMGVPLVLNLEGGYTPANVVAGVEQVLLALKGNKQISDFIADMQKSHAAVCGAAPFAPHAARSHRMAEAMEARAAAFEGKIFGLHLCP